MAKSRSFREYLEKRYDNEIYNTIHAYLIENKDRLHLRLNNVERIDYIDLQHTPVKHVLVEDLPGSEISFEMLVEAQFTVTQYGNRYGEKEEDTTLWFKYSCKGDLEKNLDDVVVDNPEEYAYTTKRNNPLDDSLVPYIAKEKYDDVAAEFLKAAGYESALTTPTYIDPEKVASAFGLTVKQAKLSPDDTVFGRIYFCDDDITVYDPVTNEPSTIKAKAKTIYVDRFAHFLKNCGLADSTIIHECFHWYMHKKAYELERLYNEHASSIGCMVVGGVKNDSRESTAWMERQAHGLTPRIQMPLIGLKLFVSNAMTKYKRQGLDYLDMLQPIIDEVALHFHVSRTAAKIRLIDAGFHEAAGTFNYVDGAYVRPHSWREGAIEINQTFTIGFEDAVAYSFLDLDLRKEVESGNYEYVESHFIRRSSKYITTDKNGHRIMTEYARHHMDECALVFDLSLKDADIYGKGYHTECFLNRDEHSPVELNYKVRIDMAGATNEEQDAFTADFITRASKVADGFTKDFSQCFQACRKFMDLTYAEIARRVKYVSQDQIERIIRGQSNGEFYTIVSIIFAMELPYVLSIPLMERSPHPFIVSNEKHLAVRTAMYTMSGHNIEEVREHLSKLKIEI